MATLVVKTVKPTGGDYTTITTALADVPASLIATDEQWVIEVYEKVGGYTEQANIPTITSDATRYLSLVAAVGNEYDPVAGSGVYLQASVGFAGVLNNASCQFFRTSGIWFNNTRTLSSGRGIQLSGNDNTITNTCTTTLSATICALLNNANNLIVDGLLTVGGTTGVDFGNNSTRTANKITTIDASSRGIDTGTASTTLTNSLSIGSSDPYLGTFNAASSNNAGDGTDTPGINPFNNRTTADLVDYAGGDYRTASSSTLATSGTVDFIGYDLESGGVAFKAAWAVNANKIINMAM